MAILEGFGDPVEEINEEDFQEKIKKLSINLCYRFKYISVN